MTDIRSTFELALAAGAGQHQFVAFVPGEQGTRTAEHAFEWRSDSTALAMDLAALSQAAIAGRAPADELHCVFGQRLYDTVFAGAVGELWRARLKLARREPLRLIVRIDPVGARELLNLPWEYLHDRHDFLALSWRTPVSRLPWDLPPEQLRPLVEPLRLLVLIAAPAGLGQNELLNYAREEDVILEALGPARRAGRIEIEFAPNGALETLEAKLREFDPHMLHFVGHGVFDTASDSGSLLMETRDGRRRAVPNADFAATIERQARSLRLVFLSACQSAVAARGEGFADLGPRLLAAGIPAVVAMQFSVLNTSAIALGGTFYKGLAHGDPLDAAMAEARSSMRAASPNTVDFAVPVLFLADPQCMQVDQAAMRAARPQAAIDLTGVASVQRFVGRAAELRELQTKLDPEGGSWRAAILHGLGGMGKTVLAARLAERMAPRFDGVKSISITPTTKAQDILDQIDGFLRVNNARLNSPQIAEFARAKDQPLPLESKAAALIDVLRALKLLLIFDNYEDVLPNGRLVSRATPMPQVQPVEAGAQVDEAQAGVDPDLARLISLLLANVPGPNRFLFTSRVDFEPLEPGRLQGAIGHRSLGEMQFRDAVYLMDTLPPLDALPVAVLPEQRRDRAIPPSSAAAASSPLPRTGEGLGVRALSMRDLYAHLGGHPYTIALFARHAGCSSTEAVLSDLEGVRKELLDFTLLDRAAAALPERARLLLRRAAIYDEPVPLESLAWLLGDERDAMPPVADDVAALIGWGLLTRPPNSGDYATHALVRDWARDQWTDDERLELLRRAAQFWLGMVQDSRNLGDYLNARHYLFLAGDYEQADDIVQMAYNYLVRWGQIELVLRLLNESVRTLSGSSRAVALGNLANVYQMLGDYKTARQYYEQVLAEFQVIGARPQVAAVLHGLGNLHYLQGEYEAARQRYQQTLAIKEDLDNRAGVAITLHQLGMLHQHQGEYEPARQRYQQSLAIKEDLGNRAGVAITLHQLGNLHQQQGEYEPARQRYQQSLAIKQELGDRDGVARTLHQLGLLHQQQGEYEQARQRYQQSLAINEGLGDRAGVAITLHQLGMLHQDQGEYDPARQRYQQVMIMYQELGNRDGVAKILHALGTLHYQQGEYEQARQRYQQSLAIDEELGDRAGVASSLHGLGMLHQQQSEYEPARQRYQQALVIMQELGNLADLAMTLAQLGLLEEHEQQPARAVVALEQALAIFEQLGMPEREKARRNLARLRDKIGEQAFEAVLAAANLPLPSLPSDESDDDAEQGMTREQALETAVNNTIAVLTSVPEKKREWWGALGQWQQAVQAQGDDDLAAFCGLLREVVEGQAAAQLAARVPAALREAWAIGIERGLAGAGGG